MNKYILILMTMLFLHVVDDYYLQGCLANMKQKTWWEQNAPDKLYKHDYIVALFWHGFSWSFMINLPIAAYYLIMGVENYTQLFISIISNAICHSLIDDEKANEKTINLIEDQCLHLVQIIIAWTCLFVC